MSDCDQMKLTMQCKSADQELFFADRDQVCSLSDHYLPKDFDLQLILCTQNCCCAYVTTVIGYVTTNFRMAEWS